MRRRWILAALYASPLVAIGIYAFRLGGIGNGYFLSVALGLLAYTYGCNQLVLAAHLPLLVQTLGRKRLRSLHATSAFLMLFAAGLHGLLKVGAFWGGAEGQRPGGFFAGLFYALRFGLGFKRFNFQVLLGEVCWWILLFGSLSSLLLVSPGFLSRLRPAQNLRRGLLQKIGLHHGRALELHRIWAILILAMLAHELLASSTIFSSNPLGALWLITYLAVSIGVFARSRAARRRGRARRLSAGRPLVRGHADD